MRHCFVANKKKNIILKEKEMVKGKISTCEIIIILICQGSVGPVQQKIKLSSPKRADIHSKWQMKYGTIKRNYNTCS